jgi:aminopeptidase N
MAQAADMARLYTQVAGGCPYPSLTLALIEQELPGGHSPAYFSVVNQVLPSSRPARKNWAGDPAAFADFPEYVLAHEVAHQWWGQAVGTKNYHEQWISEGFAQYFAALYAEKTYGPLAYRTIIRQFARWARDTSDEGPVYLGARLGHIQGDSRIFRALVYNKGALVLHMLRQQLGDEAFYRALARIYADFRFRKAGTDDVQRVFEAEAGRSLSQFFEGWVFGQDLPRLTFSASTEAGADSPIVAIRLAQEGPLFDVPVPIVLDFEDGSSRTIVVPLTGRTASVVVPIDRPLRRAYVSTADLAATVQTR